MDGSLGHFKATLSRRKERKAKNKSKFEKGNRSLSNSDSKTTYRFPKLTPKELEKVKATIKLKKQTQVLNEMIIFAAILIAIISVILFLNI
tara:strand:+ start:247 stop:519 length:273 start_codon:yes stop_codon:yes gene_type:complete